jgi:hypothetical protein
MQTPPIRRFSKKEKSIVLCSSGLSTNPIGGFFGVTTVSALKWIQVLGSKLCLKIQPSEEDKIVVMEVDEFWHCLEKRNKKSGFLRPIRVLGKQPMGGEFGDRSAAIFQRIYHGLKQWDVLFCSIDH